MGRKGKRRHVRDLALGLMLMGLRRFVVVVCNGENFEVNALFIIELMREW